VVGAGAVAATTARRWCWRGYLSPTRGERDVHVKASAGVRVRGGVIGTGLARHGVDTDGAAALMPAPWVAADPTAVAGLVRAWERWLVVKHALASQEGGAPSSAFACARQPATARPWRRRQRGGRAGGPAQEKGQRPGLASRVTGRACGGARLREGVAARTDARANATKTGRLPTARGARLGRRRTRIGEGGGTCKKTRPSLARWPASPAAARRRGAAGVPPRLDGRGVHK
jgi:hypothetical protein